MKKMTAPVLFLLLVAVLFVNGCATRHHVIRHDLNFPNKEVTVYLDGGVRTLHTVKGVEVRGHWVLLDDEIRGPVCVHSSRVDKLDVKIQRNVATFSGLLAGAATGVAVGNQISHDDLLKYILGGIFGVFGSVTSESFRINHSFNYPLEYRTDSMPYLADKKRTVIGPLEAVSEETDSGEMEEDEVDEMEE